MVLLGILAIFLYYESAHNTEKVRVQIPISNVTEMITKKVKVKIPISNMTEMITEKLNIDSKPIPPESIKSTPKCSGSAECISGKITKITDGDTIKVNDKSIRFALASAPELNTLDGQIAKDFVSSICPVGSSVLVDEDDGQTDGSFGRMLAVVYCNDVNLNEQLLESGNAKISTLFCSESEFSKEPWAIKFGCTN